MTTRDDVLVIEDDDGFTTEWPWPSDRLLLANGDFVGVCEQAHDRLRSERGGERSDPANGVVPSRRLWCEDSTCEWVAGVPNHFHPSEDKGDAPNFGGEGGGGTGG